MDVKIVSIVGARPQFIKLGPFSREIRKHFQEIIIHTGQHYDEAMSSLLFRDLEIPKPDYNMNIGSSSHGVQTGKMLADIENILMKEKPAYVVLFGDTNTTLAGSLAAVKMGIRTIHIEAGLRSFNRSMPEEINRIVVDHTADYLFAPTPTAMQNLSNEGLASKSFLTGDIMVDALTNNLGKSLEISKIEQTLNLSNGFYLVTLHRPYNVDSSQNLKLILEKLSNLDKSIIFPVHPRTKQIINSSRINIPPHITLTDPLGYLDFLKLEYLSSKIITDSGGIQKEAYLLHKPCITLRPETEWLETVENGWNILADYLEDNFTQKVVSFKPTGIPYPVFGEFVSGKMVELIKSF